MRDNNNLEIKLQSRTKYYFNLIKDKLLLILRPIFVVIVLISTLYISFYVLLLFIILVGVRYIFQNIKK